ncbi:hypothetical protein TNCV_1036201, partial [Trichonephila clavipes]
LFFILNSIALFFLTGSDNLKVHSSQTSGNVTAEIVAIPPLVLASEATPPTHRTTTHIAIELQCQIRGRVKGPLHSPLFEVINVKMPLSPRLEGDTEQFRRLSLSSLFL